MGLRKRIAERRRDKLVEKVSEYILGKYVAPAPEPVLPKKGSAAPKKTDIDASKAQYSVAFVDKYSFDPDTFTDDGTPGDYIAPAPAAPAKPQVDLSGVKFSIAADDEEDPYSGMKFQRRDIAAGIAGQANLQERRNNINVSFSIKSRQEMDAYSSAAVRLAMRNLSGSGTPQKTLRAIEETKNRTFVDKMLDYIREKDLRDSDVYKAAQLDRRLFSKMVSDRDYRPSKDTCVAVCLALKLSLSEAEDMLSRAGFAFSHSSRRNIILKYFFREGICNIFDVNEVLDRLEQKILGRT